MKLTLTPFVTLVMGFVVIATQPVSAQDRVVVVDWQEHGLVSKHGTPLSFEWQLERAAEPTDYMDDRYEFWFRFRSSTVYAGQPQPIYVGFDIAVEDRQYNIGFAKALRPGEETTYDFWHHVAEPAVVMATSRGWVGTFLTEIETETAAMSCAELAVYRDERLPQIFDRLSRAYSFPADHIAAVRDVREELEGMATRADVGGVATVVNTAANFLSGLLGNFASRGMERAVTAVDLTLGAQETMIELARQGEGAFNEKMGELFLSRAGALLQAAGSDLADFVPVVSSVTSAISGIESYDDYRSARDTIDEQLRMVEQQMLRANEALRSERVKLELFNEVKGQMDAYLEQECS